MLDWGYVLASGLWIGGLAVILASLSYHDWLAQVRGARLRDLLATPGFLLAFSAGLLLFSLGLLFLRPSWLEKAGWGISAGFFLWQIVTALAKPLKKPKQ